MRNYFWTLLTVIFFLFVDNILMYVVLLTLERCMRALSSFYRLFYQHW